MGDIRKVIPVKAVCGITFADQIDLETVLARIEAELLPVQDRTDPFDFVFTHYYEKEMGKDLKKCFISFRGLIGPELLPEWKWRTNGLESEWAVGANRTVNLDPGYVTAAKLVLASTKDFAHRVYLERGIYGDVQLRFRGDAFTPLEWTYPDYRTELALDFFHRVRGTFMNEEKHV
jgi:hypothetical protein